jgi:hypothetical protein
MGQGDDGRLCISVTKRCKIIVVVETRSGSSSTAKDCPYLLVFVRTGFRLLRLDGPRKQVDSPLVVVLVPLVVVLVGAFVVCELSRRIF